MFQKTLEFGSELIIYDKYKLFADGTKHWQHDIKEKPADKYLDWAPPQSQSNAIDIELTSYILLNYAMNNDVNSGLPVLKWLTSQRNPDGGFSSTQVFHVISIITNNIARYTNLHE